MQRIRERLKELSNEKYRDFSKLLIPNIDNILGVRIPMLRKIAKEIYKSDWESFIESECEYMEETMIQGMITGFSGRIEFVEKFIPKINNWAVCDTFCTTLKFVKDNKPQMWECLQKYLKSTKEYEIRFALVTILNYFIEQDYLECIFDALNKFSSRDYYAQMAAAWLVSICFVKFPNETNEFLKTTKLNDWTYNKSIQKIIESLKVDKQTKQRLRLMKR